MECNRATSPPWKQHSPGSHRLAVLTWRQPQHCWMISRRPRTSLLAFPARWRPRIPAATAGDVRAACGASGLPRPGSHRNGDLFTRSNSMAACRTAGRFNFGSGQSGNRYLGIRPRITWAALDFGHVAPGTEQRTRGRSSVGGYERTVLTTLEETRMHSSIRARGRAAELSTLESFEAAKLRALARQRFEAGV